jgi:hypothetical protein
VAPRGRQSAITPAERDLDDAGERLGAANVCTKEMRCDHDGYHAIQTAYDHSGGQLVYFWTCERCGMRLGEARREEYRPAFYPSGNKRPRAIEAR